MFKEITYSGTTKVTWINEADNKTETGDFDIVIHLMVNETHEDYILDCIVEHLKEITCYHKPKLEIVNFTWSEV